MKDPIPYVERSTLDTYIALMDQVQRPFAVRQFALGAMVGAGMVLVAEALEPGPEVCGVPRTTICAAVLGLLTFVVWRAHRAFRAAHWKAQALR